MMKGDEALMRAIARQAVTSASPAWSPAGRSVAPTTSTAPCGTWISTACSTEAAWTSDANTPMHAGE